MSVFDNDASTYDQWYTTPMGRHVDYVETSCALGLLQPFSGMKILDAGCGTGNFSLKLARIGCRVTGIDVSEKMLAFAEQKAREEKLDVDFRIMDVCSLSFGDETFDAVTSMAAFEFLNDPELAMEEMFRILKKNGALLIGTINKESPWGELYRALAKKDGNVFRHARLKTEEDLRKFTPSSLVAVEECLFAPPDAKEDDLSREKEIEFSDNGRGGFLCALWKKS